MVEGYGNLLNRVAKSRDKDRIIPLRGFLAERGFQVDLPAQLS
jgi:hypothetical protein